MDYKDDKPYPTLTATEHPQSPKPATETFTDVPLHDQSKDKVEEPTPPPIQPQPDPGPGDPRETLNAFQKITFHYVTNLVQKAQKYAHFFFSHFFFTFYFFSFVCLILFP